MNFALGKEIIMTNMSGHLAGYVVSQFVNLMIYYFLIKNNYFSLGVHN